MKKRRASVPVPATAATVADAVVADMLRAGAVGVLPTDTVYGIVGSALRKDAVEKIYRLRRRDLRKPMIILIASARELARFGIAPAAAQREVLRRVWPGKVSVVLPCLGRKFGYLHRGTRSLAFRVPDAAWLRRLLAATGPLVAPSANFEGGPPAKTVSAARRYFKDRVAFYGDVGRLDSRPSTLISITPAGRITVLREGAVAAGRLV